MWRTKHNPSHTLTPQQMFRTAQHMSCCHSHRWKLGSPCRSRCQFRSSPCYQPWLAPTPRDPGRVQRSGGKPCNQTILDLLGNDHGWDMGLWHGLHGGGKGTCRCHGNKTCDPPTLVPLAFSSSCGMEMMVMSKNTKENQHNIWKYSETPSPRVDRSRCLVVQNGAAPEANMRERRVRRAYQQGNGTHGRCHFIHTPRHTTRPVPNILSLSNTAQRVGGAAADQTKPSQPPHLRHSWGHPGSMHPVLGRQQSRVSLV